MTDVAETELNLPVSLEQRSRRRALNWRRLLFLARRYPLGAFGACVLFIALLAAVAPGVFATHDPNESLTDSRLLKPGGEHWFGTDHLARDLYSRVVYGMQTSVIVASGATILATLTGVTIGLVSGYSGRWIDNVLQRCVDIILAFPGLILALTIVAMLGSSVTNIIIAISVGAVPNVARVVRGSVLAAKEEDYVMAARTLGASGARVAVRHVLPNAIAPVIVLSSILFGLAIIIEASLSFLGVGVNPPTPTLGGMLSGQSRRFMLVAWWMAVFPGLMLSLVVFAVNLFGDSLRDGLDPRLSRRG